MSKNIDWDNLGFGYVETDYRYLTTYKDGKMGRRRINY